jgi:hypothetical protein
MEMRELLQVAWQMIKRNLGGVFIVKDFTTLWFASLNIFNLSFVAWKNVASALINGKKDTVEKKQNFRALFSCK